ncbi:hypothetical protein M408DRAFT_77306 [Serendipita vermifera MAFF 305830]|uniref:BTB domain-containing protein n=1 Tax=Serendipita vermifera MAFF 305830 TaxID=933852 RepID=A0A0C3AG65_SERVB|nr:hypothetical protein M408DRAFT_77306 [Serendipita vermifera MAFF 305830]
MFKELYVIVVSGERLLFTKDQLQSDPGNYFATYFFGEFAEGTQGAKELAVEKDVQLFKLIQAHLRGYKILPLADTAVPWYMTKEGALDNLLSEAQYYCLQKLVDKIRAEMSEAPKSVVTIKPIKRYKFWVGWYVCRHLFGHKLKNRLE